MYSASSGEQKISNMQGSPVVVLNTNTERHYGRRVQISNIAAAKAVSDIVRTCLGPRAMLKMLLDPMGGVLITNDGHAILREIDVSHPAAKTMIELSRTQDSEVGDGTTTVIILAGEVLANALPFFEMNLHPVVIIKAFKEALEFCQCEIDKISVPVDPENDQELLKVIKAAVGTKMVSRWSDLICQIALNATKYVTVTLPNGKKDIDTQRYAKIEKVPGGEIEESVVLDGVMINKDITHPNMRRRIESPRIVLLDCSLEYKKGESQTNIEIQKEEDWAKVLEIEERQIKAMCDMIIAVKPDLVFTEKGVSDLAQHYLMKANISCIRRLRKTDNNRISRAVGAKIVHRLEDIKESDVGTRCGLFHVDKIGDEYFTFLTKCVNPKACTIVLRGPSKDIINEIERNLHDALAVTRNIFNCPKLCPGGGATEMALSHLIFQKASSIEGVMQLPFRAIGQAMTVIPRIIAQNCGANTINILSQLSAEHAEGRHTFGIDGDKGVVVDMHELGIWEPQVVKLQSIKTAIESACLLLRVDDIVSGVRRRDNKEKPMAGPTNELTNSDD